MTQESGPPSGARRLVTALARMGLDLRPLFQRGRNFILRPVRHEVSLESQAWQARLAAQQAGSERLRSELEASREGLAAFKAEILRLESHLTDLSARLAAELSGARTQSEAAQSELAGLSAQLTAARKELSELSARVETERSRDRSHTAILERLITETPRQRLPSVERRIKEMPSPVVSVILPTRNRAHVVGDAIASVQSQHFTDWELIIVDDGSVDDTAAAVAPYLADHRIRYVARPAAGPSAARNHGLELARGGLIAYLDSDNTWYPDFLAAAVNEFAADPQVELVYGMLVTDAHSLDGSSVLWRPFDRDQLLAANYIDINVVVHRKAMVERHGGFDEQLDRLTDWDLVLRYTEAAPARALPVLAARYRVRDAIRITDTVPIGPDLLAIKRKWIAPLNGARRPRVLYVLWQYPQLSETYIEGEIACMRRWGVHVEVWCELKPTAPYPPSVPVHRGTLADAVRAVQPDLIHIHWIGCATRYADTLAQLGLPVTVRLHGFDTTFANVPTVLAQPWIFALYGFPYHLRLIGGDNPKLRAVTVAFDTSLFEPFAEKDRRLVLRAGAALPSKDLPLFLELAKRLPDHRCVLAIMACTNMTEYIDRLHEIRRQTNSPCEILVNVPHADLAVLMKQAGIYVHTARLPDEESGTPIGMPVSLAEAMATGAHVLARDLPELRDFIGNAGATYRDVDHAAEIVAATAGWSDETWKRAWLTSTDRAFVGHADEIVLRPIFEDWCSILHEQQRA